MQNIASPQAYQDQYQKSIDQPEAFWSEIANEFTWRKKWDKVLEWDFNKAETKWFINGKLNITENCLDRHLAKRANQTAIIWEPNNPAHEARHITYQQLFEEVNKTANMLKASGVKKGDRVYAGLTRLAK